MNEDSIQIEFTDEELEGNVVDTDPQNLLNGGVGNVQEQIQGTEDSQVTPSQATGSEDESGSDTEGTPTEGDTGSSQETVVVPQTDAELATLYNVSEDEIKYAKSMGWSQKEKFRGNPSDWKDPKAFIEIAEQSAPVMRERLKEMSKKMSEMQKAFPAILEIQKRELQNRVDSLTAANDNLQKELAEAHAMADSRRAADIAEKITENKLKIAITNEQAKHIGEKDGLNDLANQNNAPDTINIEKERAWRDAILPKLTLEQREIYNEAAKFVAMPQNADKTTDERIAYIEGKIFGRRYTPSVAPVARPTTGDVTSSVPQARNEYEGWDSLSAEEKKVAVSVIEDSEWYQNRERDPKAKAMWNEFKKQFTTKQGA